MAKFTINYHKKQIISQYIYIALLQILLNSITLMKTIII